MAIACFWSGFNGLYGQDSHENYRYLRFIVEQIGGIPAHGYFQTAILYPIFGAFAAYIVPEIHALQLISLIASGFCYIGFCRLLNLLYPSGTQRQRFAFLLLFMSPYYLRAAVSALPDMLAMMWTVWSLLYYFKWKNLKKIHHAALALALAVLAAGTRYTVVFLLLPLAGMILRVCRQRISYLLLLLFAGILAFTPVMLFKSTDILDFLSHPWLKDWSPANLIRRNFNFGQSHPLPNGLAALSVLVHPGFCFLSIPLIWICLRQPRFRPEQLSLLTGSVPFLCFIACLPVQELRLFLPVLPALLIILYPYYERLVYRFRTRNMRVGVYLLAVLIQTALCFRSLQPVVGLQKQEQYIASVLRTAGEGRLITFEMEGALRTYGVPQEIVNLCFVANPALQNDDLLLINPRKLEENYRESPAYTTFSRLRQNQSLLPVRSLGAGWELYRIRN